MAEVIVFESMGNSNQRLMANVIVKLDTLLPIGFRQDSKSSGVETCCPVEIIIKFSSFLVVKVYKIHQTE